LQIRTQSPVRGKSMNSYRLIYKSVATEKVVSNQTLRNLESQAAEANAAKGITGLLLLSGNVFLQVLEGSAGDLTDLFGRIMQDERHHRLELITFDAAPERLFDDWNLRLIDLYDLPGEKRAVMAAKYQQSEGSILIPDDKHLVYALLLDARHLCASMPWGSVVDAGNRVSSA